MSKIAETKALEAYPIKITRSETKTSIGEKYDANYINRQIYIKGYDQAMKDFLEKTCEWLSKNARNYYSAYATSDKLIEDFKTTCKMKKCKDCFITSCSYRGIDDTECFYQKQKYVTEEAEHWWQSFRAEAAKDILCSIISTPKINGFMESLCKMAIDYADELIKQLKEKKEK